MKLIIQKLKTYINMLNRTSYHKSEYLIPKYDNDILLNERPSFKIVNIVTEVL